jgi:hypothetical protein
LEKDINGAVELDSLSGDFLRKRGAIHGVDHPDERSDVLHLVRLEMSDEVPRDVIETVMGVFEE